MTTHYGPTVTVELVASGMLVSLLSTALTVQLPWVPQTISITVVPLVNVAED